jgi:ABC-2 type transport system permease protein
MAERMSANARILDRGYRAYAGARLGVPGAVHSLTKHSVQRVLGFKRVAWAKVLPLLTIFLAYVPAIVFVGASVLIDDLLLRAPDFLPSYGDYYGYVSAAILVFAAFVAPELLCTDRRTGMLGLYLASPLTRNTYLLAKALAVLFVLLLVTLGPPLFMLVARTVAGTGPDGPTDVVRLFGQIVVSGLVVGLLQSSLSLAVSSTTTRKAAASAAIILVLLGSAAVAGALVEGADAPTELWVLNLFGLPFELVQRVYGQSGELSRTEVSTPFMVTAYVGWTTLFTAIVWLRYRRLAVTR